MKENIKLGLEKISFNIGIGAGIGAAVGGGATYLNDIRHRRKTGKLKRALKGAAVGGGIGAYASVFHTGMQKHRRRLQKMREAREELKESARKAREEFKESARKAREERKRQYRHSGFNHNDDFWENFNKKYNRDDYRGDFNNKGGRYSGAHGASGAAGNATHETAAKYFGIKGAKTKAEAKKMMRKRILKDHPDRGGSEEAMKVTNDMKNKIESSDWFQKLAFTKYELKLGFDKLRMI